VPPKGQLGASHRNPLVEIVKKLPLDRRECVTSKPISLRAWRLIDRRLNDGMVAWSGISKGIIVEFAVSKSPMRHPRDSTTCEGPSAAVPHLTDVGVGQ
jgi:hypothetical protein